MGRKSTKNNTDQVQDMKREDAAGKRQKGLKRWREEITLVWWNG